MVKMKTTQYRVYIGRSYIEVNSMPHRILAYLAKRRTDTTYDEIFNHFYVKTGIVYHSEYPESDLLNYIKLKVRRLKNLGLVRAKRKGRTYYIKITARGKKVLKILNELQKQVGVW